MSIVLRFCEASILQVDQEDWMHQLLNHENFEMTCVNISTFCHVLGLAVGLITNGPNLAGRDSFLVTISDPSKLLRQIGRNS